ncbi:bactofilin family protein [Halomonas sp. HL-93]|uniref:bactofilin family protein n=1 Tax=Halomonas sp. HL-93 TaxID=1666906 RepID=UPI0006DAFFD1|nr:polymer-forming cytoskeletal protein [Halomonas sp. HL-93]KPQ23684.1 MAG: bactofilin protein [Halomonas sp. HL-93]SBR47593.1 protein CcmA, bactofilin family [Halomonas sp. HL-93]
MFSKAKSTAAHQSATATEEKIPYPEQKSLPTASRQSTSVIGSNTQVHGDINSDEDITIEGQITGVVTCKQHTVTLGSNGSLNGDAYAHTLRISGSVEGNLVALHKVTVHDGANVTGTITTPCLVLEDGSVFHGSIDMNPDNDVFASVFTSQQLKGGSGKAKSDHNRADTQSTSLPVNDGYGSEKTDSL